MSRRGNCTFSEELQKLYPCFTKCNSKYEAYCTICKAQVNLSNKGKYDIEQHIKSLKHSRALSAGEKSHTMNEYFRPKFSKLDDKIAAAEGALAFHCLKHRQSFRSTDCTSNFFSKIFDDSDIAKNVSSARTKTRSITVHVIAPYCIELILKELDSILFISFSTDASNHGNKKIFPLLIQYFSTTEGICVKLIYLDALPNETAQTVVEYIVKILTKYNLTNKSVAFGADNCNTNFGGLRRKGDINVFKFLKNQINDNLIGIGCNVHILHNSAKQGIDLLPFDVESIVMKIFNHFACYTVRTETLKDFCNFVEIEYKELLRHTPTRWLSLYPAVNRILQVFPALKSYFLSLDACPTMLKIFFEYDLSEALFYFVHSLMYLFHENTLTLERESNSLLETMDILKALVKTLNERYNQVFLPLKVKSCLIKSRKDGLESDAKIFENSVKECYSKSLQYLTDWTSQLNEFQIFKWMSLEKIVKWENIGQCIEYLNQKGITIDDSKCFDQHNNLNQFLNDHCSNVNFKNLPSDKKWVEYFNTQSNQFYTEILKIVQFFFAIPGQNANVERVFSMLDFQWTRERNKFKVSTMRSILAVTYNMKQTTCSQFYSKIKDDKIVLQKIRSSEKYNDETSSDED